MALTIPVLEHELLRLEPLSLDHVAELRLAAPEDPSVFALAAVPSPDTVEAYVRDSIDRAGDEYAPLAQVLPDGRAVGHTSYLAPRWWPGAQRLLAIEIGTTWLSPRVQGTAINSVAKLLLMRHAFEALQVARVDIKTDARNERARGGILAVGARFEGVLRNWQPSQAIGESDRLRDTAMHSVTSEEWPQVQQALVERIAAKRSAAHAPSRAH